MGYFTPFIAPKGRDGGVDILAYSDPLGTVAPRIVVQVKHRQQKATVQEIRELSGLLQRDGDTGLFVSSGGFTTEAEREVKGSRQHIENMDLEKFIGFFGKPITAAWKRKTRHYFHYEILCSWLLRNPLDGESRITPQVSI